MDKTIRGYGYRELAAVVSREIGEVLSLVDEDEVRELIARILEAEKVFVFGVGRVFLSLQIVAKRLAHLGVDVQVVGCVTEKHIGDRDLLLVASGSGESALPIQIAQLARTHGATVALITSALESTLKSTADFAVHLPAPTKKDPECGVRSVQSMTYLFDQSLHVFGDILCLMLQLKQGLEDEDIWKRHANLE